MVTRIITALLLVGILIAGISGVLYLEKTGFIAVFPRKEPVSQPETEKDKTPAPKEIPIYTYHYVEVVTDERDFIRKSLAITPYTFEEHLKRLNNEGFETYFASDIPKILRGEIIPNKKPVVLTFDDGYRDFYTDALPLLKKYKAKATIYVVPAFIGKLNYMTKEQIAGALDTQLVELGSHTVQHASLTSLKPDDAKYQITESRKMLENTFGTKVSSFAYPYGFYNADLAKVVEEAGYTNAVTTDEGKTQDPKDLFTLKRMRAGYLNIYN